MEAYNFDLERIFLGDYPLMLMVEIAFRTTIMLFYLLLVLRLLGKRTLTQFSPFEFILIIALGSAVGDPMFYPEVPLLHGMVVITVVALIERMLAWVTNNHDKIEEVLEGSPLCLIIEGCFQLEELKKSTVSRKEIYMELRSEKVEQLGQVKRAYLEADGEMSVFLFAEDRVRFGLPILPELINAEPFLANTAPTKAGKYACVHCGKVITLEAGQVFSDCPRCQEKGWLEAVKEIPISGVEA